MIRLPKHVLFFWAACVLVAGFLAPLHAVEAVLGSCSADVSPSSVTTSTDQRYTVSFSTVDSIQWIKITRPSDNFSVTSATAEGWNASVSSPTDVVFTLGGSGSTTLYVDASSGGSEAGSANWSVQASDDPGGASPTTCSGSQGTAISGAGADTTAPEISGIVVSDITDSAAKISWTTDESSNSVADYGTSDEYGSSVSGDSSVTSHSVSISGLSANTTYHYNVKSSDAAGNTGESGDNTFVTAKQGTTTTTTTTGTVTTVVVTRATPTPIPDTRPPSVTVTTDLTRPFTQAPTIRGKASDGSGVAKLEYSLDAGRNWSVVDVVDSPNRGTTAFSFTPVGLLDDNYDLQIRATDGKGNAGVHKAGTLIIDRLPPLVGGNVLSLGPQVLVPQTNGSIVVLAGLDQKITVSAVGGPTKISLGYLSDSGNQGSLELKKNPDNGLWSGILRFDEPGRYTLTTDSVDGAQNRKQRTLNSVVAIGNGTVSDGRLPVTNGWVSVYYLDGTTKQFILWDGGAYGQDNPQQLDEKGRYKLYLPSGTYYFRIAAPGYQTLVSSIFSLTGAQAITSDFSLTHARALRLWRFLIPLPDFRQTVADVDVSLSGMTAGTSVASSVIGTEMPYFTFPYEADNLVSTDLYGKPTVITFLNTWSPTAAAQLAILRELARQKEIQTAVVVPQETAASIAIFRKRGGYGLPIVADADGILVEPLGLQSLPTHIFLNRKGVIEHVRSGVFTREELLDALIR